MTWWERAERITERSTLYFNRVNDQEFDLQVRTFFKIRQPSFSGRAVSQHCFTEAHLKEMTDRTLDSSQHYSPDNARRSGRNSLLGSADCTFSQQRGFCLFSPSRSRDVTTNYRLLSPIVSFYYSFPDTLTVAFFSPRHLGPCSNGL